MPDKSSAELVWIGGRVAWLEAENAARPLATRPAYWQLSKHYYVWYRNADRPRSWRAPNLNQSLSSGSFNIEELNSPVLSIKWTVLTRIFSTLEPVGPAPAPGIGLVIHEYRDRWLVQTVVRSRFASTGQVLVVCGERCGSWKTGLHLQVPNSALERFQTSVAAKVNCSGFTFFPLRRGIPYIRRVSGPTFGQTLQTHQAMPFGFSAMLTDNCLSAHYTLTPSPCNCQTHSFSTLPPNCTRLRTLFRNA